MWRRASTAGLMLVAFVVAIDARQDETKKAKPKSLYPHTADSQEQPGVPRGTLTKMPPWKSEVFAGTERDWWVYVPAQYDEKTPACVMVFQDGGMS